MTTSLSPSETRLLGESAAFSEALQHVSAVAPLDKPVLIVGERGTGKELIAARMHYLSARWEREYHKLNCAAISESLIESELFGHEAGAFTGAVRRHIGRFERANGGSLFMDELATSGARVQEQLLRIIEYGEFERLGGSSTQQTDVRLIAATNEDLPRLADDGEFRQDLLDRLSFDVITLPPLRYRDGDIPLLANHFANNMSQELEQAMFPGFSEAAMEVLQSHRWPGNVRELKSAVERSLYRHEDWDRPVSKIILDPFASPFRPQQRIQSDRKADTREAPQSPESTAAAIENLPIDLKARIRQQEIVWLNKALEECQFNQRKAATALGLSYHQLRAHLKKYDLLGDNVKATAD
ncbi:MAG: phage shock protein operon transcriptional activator [Pseudomonadales bacterium]